MHAAADEAVTELAHKTRQRRRIERDTLLGVGRAPRCRLRAAQERSTARYIVIQALATVGFEVDPADLVPNGRRPKLKRQN
jgi:uncharacterized membrane protein YkvA (DUF1232 family)